ncbi:hypothetical protein SALBM311S_08866 [Streptomyces alboniger]
MPSGQAARHPAVSMGLPWSTSSRARAAMAAGSGSSGVAAVSASGSERGDEAGFSDGAEEALDGAEHFGGPAHRVGGVLVVETAVRVVCCHLRRVERVEGPWCRMAPGPRRNCYTICRPWYCAGLLCPHRHQGGGQRLRGSRLLDRRPPHYRCPAVPGLKASARAILMAPGSSVLPSEITHLPSGVLRTAGDAYCSVACDSATLRQPAPSPVLRLLRLGSPLPNLPVRAPAADACTEVLLTDFTAGSCWDCSRQPLITAGHPVRSSVPSPPCNIPGFGTPPPHRPAHLQLRTAGRQFVSARPG